MTKRQSLTIVLIIFFMQGIFANIHHPLMPAYVKGLNLPDFYFGFFFAFMNLGMMFGGPFWGNLGDSGKKRIVVTIGFLIYGVFQFLFGLGSFFSPLILSVIRFISGFGIAASFTVLAGEIIILSDVDKRARNIALGAAALALGGALGQFSGGKVSDILTTQNKMFVILTVQGISVLLLSLFTFVFYKPKEVNKNGSNKRMNFFDGFKEIKNISLELFLFMLAITTFTISATNLDKYLDVYFINVLGNSEGTLGTLKMVVGIVGILSSLFLVPLFMKVKERLLLISLFQAISAVIVFIMFKDNNYFLRYLYTIYLVYIMLKTITEPLERDYISNFASNENISTMMGIRQSFYNLGTIIGPLAGAFVYDYNPKWLFYSSSIFFVLSIILIFFSFTLSNKRLKMS